MLYAGPTQPLATAGDELDDLSDISVDDLSDISVDNLSDLSVDDPSDLSADDPADLSVDDLSDLSDLSIRSVDIYFNHFVEIGARS